MHFASYGATFCIIWCKIHYTGTISVFWTLHILETWLLTCKIFWDYVSNGLLKQIPKDCFGVEFSLKAVIYDWNITSHFTTDFNTTDFNTLFQYHISTTQNPCVCVCIVRVIVCVCVCVKAWKNAKWLQKVQNTFICTKGKRKWAAYFIKEAHVYVNVRHMLIQCVFSVLGTENTVYCT